MALDKLDFFRSLTVNICSSLDLDLALKRCLDYLAAVFPVDEMSLHIHDQRHGLVRVLSRATVNDDKPASEVIQLPGDYWSWISRQTNFRPVIMTDQLIRTLPKVFADFFPHRPKSRAEIVLPLTMDGARLGLLVVVAPLGVDYEPAHLDLIASVMEPFAIALSNAVAYQRVVDYQDILIDDKIFFQNELTHSDQVIGEAGGLQSVMGLVNQAAPMSNTILITGETGVGKEVVANAIHQRSKRRSGPFVKVNCGAIAESLLDSELFGHEKGAFTGAAAQKRGRFERAEGGTIFLDEIGELSLSAQVRLLRVLANREIERVGGTQVIPLNIRVITATHRDLQKMVREGSFREDLWFRLNVFPIQVPPLRERKEDIPALADYFLRLKCQEFGLGRPAISREGLRNLQQYDWPGNVRELDNVIERELIRFPGRKLHFEFLESTRPGRSVEKPGPIPTEETQGGFQPLDTVIKEYIQRVLKATRGRVGGKNSAAEILEVHPSTLRSRMKKFRLNRFGETKPGRS